MSFNVMPNRDVTETLLCKEYRAWPGYVEATFDRLYQSEMEKSPSHLIVVTAQAHAQKLAYIAIAESFGRPYVPTDPEYLKMWWTCSYSTMPKMIREEEDIKQLLWIIELVKTGPKAYAFEAYSRVSDMELWARAAVFLI